VRVLGRVALVLGGQAASHRAALAVALFRALVAVELLRSLLVDGVGHSVADTSLVAKRFLPLFVGSRLNLARSALV